MSPSEEEWLQVKNNETIIMLLPVTHENNYEVSMRRYMAKDVGLC